MTRLTLGVLLWSFTHLVPAAFTGVKKALVGRMGENAYKGVFTVSMALAIYLLISGWKTATADFLFTPPAWGRPLSALLVAAAFILFFAPYPANNIKRLLRHPQLTGVVCWGAGHLLANGEARSVVLFAGLAAWALVEMPLLNRRDGDWVRPPVAARRNDVVLVLGALAAYAVLAAAHRWLFGVSPFPF